MTYLTRPRFSVFATMAEQSSEHLLIWHLGPRNPVPATRSLRPLQSSKGLKTGTRISIAPDSKPTLRHGRGKTGPSSRNQVAEVLHEAQEYSGGAPIQGRHCHVLRSKRQRYLAQSPSTPIRGETGTAAVVSSAVTMRARKSTRKWTHEFIDMPIVEEEKQEHPDLLHRSDEGLGSSKRTKR